MRQYEITIGRWNQILRQMENNLAGKVVIITGASSGIGEETARMLAKQQCKVVLGARRLEKLGNIAQQIEQEGGKAVFEKVDVRSRADLQRIVELAKNEFHKVDVLINNAGIGPISPLDEFRVDDWDHMIDINIKGVLYGIAAALPVFRKQGFGQIINVASTAGFKTVPNQAVYSATISAVRAITEGLRQEAGDKLRVTIISPGFVLTNFADSMTNEEIKSQIIAALDKMAIQPVAITEAIAYAISQPDHVDVGEIVVRPTAQT